MPLAINCAFLANTMVLDLVCFTNLLANNKSDSWLSVGEIVVTVFKSASVSDFKSLSCAITPFNKLRKDVFGNSTLF